MYATFANGESEERFGRCLWAPISPARLAMFGLHNKLLVPTVRPALPGERRIESTRSFNR